MNYAVEKCLFVVKVRLVAVLVTHADLPCEQGFGMGTSGMSICESCQLHTIKCFLFAYWMFWIFIPIPSTIGKTHRHWNWRNERAPYVYPKQRECCSEGQLLFWNFRKTEKHESETLAKNHLMLSFQIWFKHHQHWRCNGRFSAVEVSSPGS